MSKPRAPEGGSHNSALCEPAAPSDSGELAERQRRMGVHSARAFNRRAHERYGRFGIPKYQLSIDAHHAIPEPPKRLIPPRVITARVPVSASIHFHDQPQGWAIEVSDVPPGKDDLAAKGNAELTARERNPELALRNRGKLAKRLSASREHRSAMTRESGRTHDDSSRSAWGRAQPSSHEIRDARGTATFAARTGARRGCRAFLRSSAPRRARGRATLRTVSTASRVSACTSISQFEAVDLTSRQDASSSTVPHGVRDPRARAARLAVRRRKSEPREHAQEGPRVLKARGRTHAAPKPGEHLQKGRVYDPLAGRFATQDPITQAPFWSQGLNPYAYVFNDPVNATDPSGFLTISAGYPAGAVFGLGNPASLGGGAISLGSGVLKYATGQYIGLSATPSAQASFATGSAAATTQPGASGMHAVGQSDSIRAPVQERPPGTSLFDRAAGAQACNGTPQECAEMPQSRAPGVPNRILSDPSFKVLDTSETWIKSLQVSLALVSGAQIALEISIALKAAQFAAIAAAPSASQLLLPLGMRSAQFGKLIGWTTGGTLKQNLALTRQLIKDVPGRIGALRDAGVTKQMAQQWADFYRAEALRNARNPNAFPRSMLMQAIADLL